MEKSLTKKYYIKVLMGALICLFVMGAAMLTFAQRYYSSIRQKTLESTATVLSANVSMYYSPSFSVTNRDDYIKNQLLLYAQNYQIEIIVTDSDGEILAAVRKQGEQLNIESIPEDILNNIYTDGKYDSRTTVGGLYKSRVNVVGMPYMVRDNEYSGVVLVTSQVSETAGFMKDVFGIFLLIVGFALLISMIVFYETVKRMTQPLKEMSEAAKQFAVGDFSKRIEISGEDEVSKLSVAFNTMADSLCELERMRSSFISDVSHELKTPMTTISGFVDGILDKTIPLDKQDYYLKIVSEEVKRLSRIVNSLLDVSRIEAGKLQLNPVLFDMFGLIAKVVSGNEIRIEEKNLNITVNTNEGENYEVFADMDMIYRVVYNIIDNAIKYSPNGASIVINLAKNDGKLFFAVKNSGSYISKEHLAHIFERFYKADSSRSLDKKSTGLGLYIAKSIINAHNGELWATSKQDEYTQFVFTLPDKQEDK